MNFCIHFLLSYSFKLKLPIIQTKNGPWREKACLPGLQTTKAQLDQSDRRLWYLLIGKYHI